MVTEFVKAKRKSFLKKMSKKMMTKINKHNQMNKKKMTTKHKTVQAKTITVQDAYKLINTLTLWIGGQKGLLVPLKTKVNAVAVMLFPLLELSKVFTKFRKVGSSKTSLSKNLLIVLENNLEISDALVET